MAMVKEKRQRKILNWNDRGEGNQIVHAPKTPLGRKARLGAES